jgi:fructokinase
VPAASLLSCGPALVLVTDGPRPVRALLPSAVVKVDVPSVQVVDTIGAGYAFGGAFLSWWTSHKLTRTDLDRADPVREALRAAVEVAALTCTRAGADPPSLADLHGHPGW